MIRLPSPTTMENYVRWARQLISTLELQQRTNELSTSANNKKAEEQAEATSWFNG
jgi:hypothetical protein|tara:strand:+ start:143 stop:307 length:165 start_codon:yes stop_codon:yes gene_type:complete